MYMKTTGLFQRCIHIYMWEGEWMLGGRRIGESTYHGRDADERLP
jgi:hypothetical protein